MRRRLFLLGVIVVVALVAAVAALPAPQLPEFVSTQHQFRARFGRDPEVTATLATGVKTCAYSLPSANGAREVIVTDVPNAGDNTPDRAALFLKSAQDDLIRSKGGTLVSNRTTELPGKYPGREFVARFRDPQPGMMRVRLYLVGTRLYQVQVVGTEGYATGSAATAFLDSFAVTE